MRYTICYHHRCSKQTYRNRNQNKMKIRWDCRFLANAQMRWNLKMGCCMSAVPHTQWDKTTCDERTLSLFYTLSSLYLYLICRRDGSILLFSGWGEISSHPEAIYWKSQTTDSSLVATYIITKKRFGLWRRRRCCYFFCWYYFIPSSHRISKTGDDATVRIEN